MLSIFDHSPVEAASCRASAGRRSPVAGSAVDLASRILARRSVDTAQQPASDGVPSFVTLDPFRPRTAAIIHGLVLSTAVFCLTCFAIRYSWIHVLHVRIREVQVGKRAVKSIRFRLNREHPFRKPGNRAALGSSAGIAVPFAFGSQLAGTNSPRGQRGSESSNSKSCASTYGCRPATVSSALHRTTLAWSCRTSEAWTISELGYV